jgi:hypothetical protein
MNFSTPTRRKDAIVSLQETMRCNPQGQLVCERCGGTVRRGWVYRFGAITLATCTQARCQPPAPWVHALNFC